MSALIGAAVAAGAGMLSNRRGRKDAGDQNDLANQQMQQAIDEFDKGINYAKQGLGGYDDAIKTLRQAVGESQKGVGATKQGIEMIDALQPAIDKFAAAGQGAYDKYSRMLGPMEESLNSYYQNLNPDELAAQGNQAAQQQYQSSMNQVNDQLAANGVLTSGMQAQMAMQQGNQMAQTKAQNQMNAPHQVAQQQQGWAGHLANQGNQAFNQYGQGVQAQQNQGNAYQQAYGNLANAYGNVGNAYGNVGNAQQNKANYQGQIGNMYGNKANLYAGVGSQNQQQASQTQQLGNQSLQSGMTLGALLGEKANWEF